MHLFSKIKSNIFWLKVKSDMADEFYNENSFATLYDKTFSRI